MKNKKTLQIYKILDKYRKNPFNIEFDYVSILKKIESMVENQAPVRLVLPACHGKASSPSCVINYLPDFGEYLGIQHFAKLGQDIIDSYEYGVELILIHEGYFYTHTPLVDSDETMDLYLLKLKKIMIYPFMKSMVLKNFFPQFDTNQQAREYFLQKYAANSEEVSTLIEQHEKYYRLYINYKKIYSKYLLPQNGKKLGAQQLNREAKKYALIQLGIYIGFSRLEKEFFAGKPYIRLSALYKDPTEKEQIAINYLSNKHHFATPAFYSIVKYKNGQMDFIKKSQAVAKGYQLSYHQEFPYFEEI